MRQLGTVPDAQKAHLFADYLSTLSIDTHLEQSSQGWVVWICDEDQVPRARDEFQTFQKNPSEDRYRQAARIAQARRAEEEEEEEDRPPAPRSVAPVDLIGAQPQRLVTVTLMVLSGLITLLTNDGRLKDQMYHHLFITSPFVGAGQSPGLPEVAQGEVWRLITPIFVHFGPWHILFNMLWLWSLGTQIETRYGPWRFGLLVLGIALTSNLCQYFFSEIALVDGMPEVTRSSPSFGGMSGVVFGLFGFIWMKTIYEPTSGLFVTPGTVFLMIAWLFICMTGMVGPIANTAHVVGLIGGMVSGYGSAWWTNFGERET